MRPEKQTKSLSVEDLIKSSQASLALSSHRHSSNLIAKSSLPYQQNLLSIVSIPPININPQLTYHRKRPSFFKMGVYVPPHKRSGVSTGSRASGRPAPTPQPPFPTPPRTPSPTCHAGASSISNNNWRTTASPLKSKCAQSSTSNNYPRGLIVCLPPDASNIAPGDPIFNHPDFQRASGYNRHPAIVVGEANSKGFVLCMQATSFSAASNDLMVKYPGDQAEQRRRWLLVEDSSRVGHDNLPVLLLAKGSQMTKPTWINTEKAFCIRTSDLTAFANKANGRFQLDDRSVDTIISHHNLWYGRGRCNQVGLGDWQPGATKIPK